MRDGVLYEIKERPGGGWEVVRPLQARIQEFCERRIAEIRAGNTPSPLEPGPVVVLHFIPNGSLDGEVTVDLPRLEQNSSALRPMHSTGWNTRYNADGLFSFSPTTEGRADAYTQFFRNGTVEAATSGLAAEHNGRRSLFSRLFEDEIIEAVIRCIAVAEEFSAVPPHMALIALIGGKGCSMAVDGSRYWSQDGGSFDRDLLQAFPVVLEGASTVAAALRPCFDFFWQASGWRGSHYYQEDGSRRT